MLEVIEKRDVRRMPVPCAIQMREYSRPALETAQLLDLSAGGMRFISQRALETGVYLQVMVQPGSPVMPPLEAAVAVVRCTETDEGFDIAASIVEVETVDYPAVD